MTNRDILTDPQWVAFQRQLDAQPDSHATRAVLADWLEGQGHPWAKAIRWMVKMMKHPEPAGWFLPQPFPASIGEHCQLPTTKDIPESPVFDLLSRYNAEICLCEMYDELPLTGKDDDLPQPLTYEQRAAYCCYVCGNVPDEDGMIEHGRGCFVASEDGGGTSFVDMGDENA